MRIRARSDVARRLGQLEDAFGGELKCKCRVGAEAAGKPSSQTIVLAHPGGDDSETCPDCGGQRVVYLVHPGFPLSSECGCVECVAGEDS